MAAVAMQPAEAAFTAAVRAQAARHRGLCALDLTLENVADFEYGRWQLVGRDLGELQAAGAMPPRMGATVRRVCAAHRVGAAFDLRVELVNYKKVVLHLFNEGGVVEKDLRQLSALLHCPLADGSAPRPAQRAYAALAAAVMDAKGSRTAMQDARVFTKTICTISRHPAARPKQRLEGLPTSLVVHKRALSFLHWVRRQRDRAAAAAAAAATATAGDTGVPATSAATPQAAVSEALGTSDARAIASEAAAAVAVVEPTIVEVCGEAGTRGVVLRFLRGNTQVNFAQSNGPSSRWLPWSKLSLVSGPDLAANAAAPEPESEQEPEPAGTDAALEGRCASAWSALCADLHTVAEEEEWPAHILRYVLQLLVVRGVAKALLMADALREYVSALATVRSFGVYDQRADVNRFVFPNRNVDIIEARSRD
jgi:hypothetical protein